MGSVVWAHLQKKFPAPDKHVPGAGDDRGDSLGKRIAALETIDAVVALNLSDFFSGLRIL